MEFIQVDFQWVRKERCLVRRWQERKRKLKPCESFYLWELWSCFVYCLLKTKRIIMFWYEIRNPLDAPVSANRQDWLSNQKSESCLRALLLAVHFLFINMFSHFNEKTWWVHSNVCVITGRASFYWKRNPKATTQTKGCRRGHSTALFGFTRNIDFCLILESSSKMVLGEASATDLRSIKTHFAAQKA